MQLALLLSRRAFHIHSSKTRAYRRVAWRHLPCTDLTLSLAKTKAGTCGTGPALWWHRAWCQAGTPPRMEPACWICLQEDGQLVQPCNCPRAVHLDCLATWCLHCAGTAEERVCRFCLFELPDWKQVLGGNHHAGQLPVVAVVFQGCEWRLRVPPTAEGALRFQRQIELITGLPFNEQVHIKFRCKSPTGQDIALSGTRCLEAAIHCAAIHSARQQQQQQQQQDAAQQEEQELQQTDPPEPAQRQQQQQQQQPQEGPAAQEAQNKSTQPHSRLAPQLQATTAQPPAAVKGGRTMQLLVQKVKKTLGSRLRWHRLTGAASPGQPSSSSSSSSNGH